MSAPVVDFIPIVLTEAAPRASDPVSLADYAELSALTNIDMEYSLNDLRDALKRKGDVDGDDDTGMLSGRTLAGRQRKIAGIEEAIENTRRQIKYRQSTFQSSYPYDFDESTDTLTVRSLTGARNLYAFLLMSSNLYRIRESPDATRRSPRTILTDHFEVLTAHALSSLFPGPWMVRVVGTTASLAESEFTGSTLNKLNMIAAGLGEELVVDVSEFSPHDSGDGGLDVLVQSTFPDNARGQITLFVQCACSREHWNQKQADVSWDRIREYFRLKVPNIAVIAVPFCFRKASGAWYEDNEVRCLMLDRVRLIRLARSWEAAGPKARARRRDAWESWLADEARILVDEALSGASHGLSKAS